MAVMVLLLAAVVGGSVFGHETFVPRPAYSSMENTADDLERVTDIWYIHDISHGEGIVLVGRVERPEGIAVASRVFFHDDGSYSTALYPGRTLTFFAHGYDPLPVTRYAPFAHMMYDAGTVEFTKTSPESLRTLCGTIDVEGGAPEGLHIQCALKIRNEEYLWADHGYEGGAKVTVTAESVTVPPGGAVEFHGLSRIPYVLALGAKGFVAREIEVDADANEVIDVGGVLLSPATTYRFEYSARTRKKDGEWEYTKAGAAKTVVCDGTKQFQFTKARDGLGNRLALRMRPVEGGTQASFFFRKQNSFYDLGQMAPQDWPALDTVDVSGLDGAENILLQSGHLYYFNITNINDTAIQMLFQPVLME